MSLFLCMKSIKNNKNLKKINKQIINKPKNNIKNGLTILNHPVFYKDKMEIWSIERYENDEISENWR